MRGGGSSTDIWCYSIPRIFPPFVTCSLGRGRSAYINAQSSYPSLTFTPQTLSELAMSGFEIVGVVLAAIPLIVTTLDSYSQAWQTIDGRWFSRIYGEGRG